MKGISQMTKDLDGRWAQGWGGLKPNGVHVNVLVARRGSPTAAAIANAFTAPSEGFTPVLASLGPSQPEYQTLYPPTVILNKCIANPGMAEDLIFGAAPVGIARAVLDVVAEGLIEANQDHIILVSIWMDGNATDETVMMNAAREAVGSALREAIQGRPEAEVAAMVENRETLTHPFYGSHGGK